MIYLFNVNTSTTSCTISLYSLLSSSNWSWKLFLAFNSSINTPWHLGFTFACVFFPLLISSPSVKCLQRQITSLHLVEISYHRVAINPVEALQRSRFLLSIFRTLCDTRYFFVLYQFDCSDFFSLAKHLYNALLDSSFASRVSPLSLSTLTILHLFLD